MTTHPVQTVNPITKNAIVEGEFPTIFSKLVHKMRAYPDSTNFTIIGNFAEFRFIRNQLDTLTSLISSFLDKL